MRQLIKNNVPGFWRKRAKAGLCPVCGKTRQEFDKRMIVYCSVKCREEYASKYDFWVNVREKILKRDKHTCKKCGVNKEKAEQEWEESKKELYEEFFKKERKEIEVFRDLELQRLSKRYKEEYDEIMDDLNFFKRIRWKLKEQYKDEYCLLFSYFCKYPSFCVDHIIAICLGGDMWDEENLQTLCVKCHKEKTKEDIKKLKILKTRTQHLNRCLYII